MPESPEPFGFDQASEATDFIGDQAAKKGLKMPSISVTLGSGLKSFGERYTNPDTRLVIPVSDIPNFAKPDKQANGHDGTLIIAPIEEGSNETMAIWAGRIHYYQKLLKRIGDSWERISDPEIRKAAVVFYIAVSKCLGVQDILTSNAVGSSNPTHKVGDIVRVSDHMMDPEEDFGVPEEERWFEEKKADPAYSYGDTDYFYSQANLYSQEIYELAKEIAKEQGWELPEGVLNWRAGRGYETPAYIKARTQLGANLFGMSTVPEGQKARSIGFNNEPNGRHFGAYSLITNVAQLDHDQKITHKETSTNGSRNEDRFNPFMYELVRRRTAQRVQRTLKRA